MKQEKNELVVINHAAPTNDDNDNGNWGEDEPVRPEYIQMKQALSEGVDHIPNGTFYHKGSGQTWTTINMVVLDMHKTRHLKPSAPAYVVGEKDRCASRNGKTPITGDDRLIPQAKSCDDCPANSWAKYDKITRTGEKPRCSKGFKFLFLDEETNLPYIYEVSGQGVEPAEAAYEAVRRLAKIVKGKTGRMPNTWEYSITVGSEKGNKAFKPKFLSVNKLKAEDAAKYGPLYQQFVKNYNETVSEVPSNEYVNEYTEAEYIVDTGQVEDTSFPI